MQRLIGINLLVLTRRPPGGTGHHAISLFEALLEAERSGKSGMRFIGFAEEAAARFFSAEARSRLVILPSGNGLRRAINELIELPLQARRRRVEVMINPAFFGAAWGTQRRALIIHDLYFRSEPHLVPWRRKMLLRMVVPLLGRMSAPLFTVSRATKTELERFYPTLAGRANVLYSGNRILATAGDLATQPAFLAANKRYLLMVGHLTANKRPETVVAALARLRRGGRDLALVHVGDDAGRLRAMAESAGVAKDVIVLGPQPDPVLALCYRDCEALVIPSIREGFGLPLIEAQAQGAPVIASSCEALMEVGGDSALYFPVDSETMCAEAIETILDDPEKRAALIGKGYANSTRFRWDTTASELIDALTVLD